MVRVLAILAMVGFVFAVGAQAKEKDMTMGKEVTVKGKVEATKDAAGTVTDVKIKSMMKTYEVTLDPKGMELAQMDGKHIEATGTVTKQGKEHWLTVTNFQEKEKGKK
jgi:hypothetical protein